LRFEKGTSEFEMVVPHEGKRTFGRSKRRWEDIIQLNFKEVGCTILNLVHLIQDRD